LERKADSEGPASNSGSITPKIDLHKKGKEPMIMHIYAASINLREEIRRMHLTD
jgi:hypothetical protein